MILAIQGAIGSGKTLLATILALNCKGYKNIVANYKIDAPNLLRFESEKFLDGGYKNSLIIIDEAYTCFDSRRSMHNDNIDYSIAVFQSRKCRCDIIYTLQILSSIDLRMRETLQYLIDAEFDENLNCFCYTIKKRKVSNEGVLFFENITKRFVAFEVAKKYFNKFDTYEIVSTVEQINRRLTDKQKDKIVEELKSMKNLSKELVKFYLYKNYKIVETMLVNEIYFRARGVL